MPSPVAIHRFEDTMPSGGGAGPVVTFEIQLPYFMKPENCWVHCTSKAPVDAYPADTLVVPEWDPFDQLEDGDPEDVLDKALWLDGSVPTDTIFAKRPGCGDIPYTEVDFRLVVVEFGEGAGVHTQYVKLGVKNRRDIEIETHVDPSKAWVHVHPFGPICCGEDCPPLGKYDWAGVRSYLTRGRIQNDGTELRLENNNDASGFPGHGNLITAQVVEMEGARVQRGDGGHTFGIRQWEVDSVDLGKSFMVTSYRDPPNVAGGGRADEVTTDFFMFGGSGMASVGNLAGSGLMVWWQLIEVEDWYVETVSLQPESIGSESPASYDTELKGITDPDRTVAMLSRGWGCYNAGGLASNEDGSLMTAMVEIVDASTLRMKTRNGKFDWDATPFAIQMSPRPSISPKQVFLRNLQRIEQTITTPDAVTDLDIEAVDPEKTVVWVTAKEVPTNATRPSPVAELVDSTTVRLLRASSVLLDLDIVLYVMELEGVDVRRGWLSGGDHLRGTRHTSRTDVVEYARSFMVVQSRRVVDSNYAPSVAYTGSTMIRGMSNGSSLHSSDHTHYQIVQLRDESLVRQITVGFGNNQLERTVELPFDFPEDKRFLWYTRQFGGANADEVYFNARFTGPREITVTRYGTRQEVWVQLFCVRVDTFDVFQGEIDQPAGQALQDIPLPRAFDPERTGAFCPLQGFSAAGPLDAKPTDAEHTLKLTDETTLRAERDDADDDTIGSFYLLGFSPEPEPRSPIGPRGFYFGDREPGGECYIAKFGEVYRDDTPAS